VVCTASDDILSFHSIELQATREIPNRLSPRQVMNCLLCSSLVAKLHLMGFFPSTGKLWHHSLLCISIDTTCYIHVSAQLCEAYCVRVFLVHSQEKLTVTVFIIWGTNFLVDPTPVVNMLGIHQLQC